MNVCDFKCPISVVVPVYNRSELLVRCLDSIRGQTWRPMRMIVVDNNSSDDTRAVAEKWALRNSSSDFEVTVVGEERRGACHARQRGLDEVETEYVLFFDSDDMMRPDMVETAVRRLQADDSPDIVAWPVFYNFLDDSRRRSPGMDGDAMDSHLIHSILRTLGYAVRTDVLRKAGGWGSGLRVWDDWELGVRLLCSTSRIAWTSRPLADVYSQQQSITGIDFSSKAGEWEKSLDRVESVFLECGPERMAHYLNLVDYRRVILAADYRKEGNDKLADVLLEKTLGGTTRLGAWQKKLLRLLHRYTSAGGRGAGRIAVRLL